MTNDTDTIDEVIDILLVEPNPGDIRLFTESFRDAKLANTIHAVSDGEAALDFVHQRGAYADEQRPDIVKSHDLEADWYIEKPVEPEDFVTVVQSVGEFWVAIVRDAET